MPSNMCWGHINKPKAHQLLNQSNKIKEQNYSVLVPELEDSPRRLTNRALATKGNVFVKRTYKIE